MDLRGFEPPTSSLQRNCSTTELQALKLNQNSKCKSQNYKVKSKMIFIVPNSIKEPKLISRFPFPREWQNRKHFFIFNMSLWFWIFYFWFSVNNFIINWRFQWHTKIPSQSLTAQIISKKHKFLRHPFLIPPNYYYR